MMLLVQSLFQRLRENLWFGPGVAVVVAIGLAVVLVRAVPSTGEDLPIGLVDVSTGAVYALLASLLAGMITAASVVSSLTIVALQTASQQFSPRLLRNFLRDTTTHRVLAVFVGTSAYLVAVMLLVENEGGPPPVAMTVALVGVLASVIVIAVFFNHVSHSIRIETILASITAETRAAADRLALWLHDPRWVQTHLGPIPDHATAVPAPGAGYVQQVDALGLLDVATTAGVEVRVAVHLGNWVGIDRPVAWWWTRDGQPPGPVDTSGIGRFGRSTDLGDAIRQQFQLGNERTLHHDVGLGIRQLVDMAIKAMSPAVNDPYTAVQAIDHLGPILVRQGRGRSGEYRLGTEDAQGHVEFVVPTLAAFTAQATDQIRRSGSREPEVVVALLDLFHDVAATTRPRDAAGLRPLVESLAADAGEGVANAQDRVRVLARAQEVLDDLPQPSPDPTGDRGPGATAVGGHRAAAADARSFADPEDP